MNKKLIALALAALPAAAMADVTIYGTIAGGIESLKTYNANTTSFNGNLQAGSLQSRTEVNDWVSKIGFKGSEDVGNGLKAIWQVESRLNVDGSATTGSGSGTLATRDSFVGFAGDSWGKVRLGKLSDYANSDMEQVDPGHYSNNGGVGNSAPSVGGLAMFTRIDGRHNNAVRYDSANWGGFSFSALWAADEAREKVPANTGSTTNNQFFNLGLSYENSGFFGKYNYGTWGDADKLGTLSDWHRFEGGYNANNIYLAFGFQQATGYLDVTTGKNSAGVNVVTAISDPGVFYNINQLSANAAGFNSDNAGAGSLASGLYKARSREIALTGGYTFGALTPYLSYAKGYNVNVSGYGDLTNTGYDQWVLGLDYALSKRTEIYTSYGHVNWKTQGAQNESSFGLGVIHNF
ncbi:porin [Chromobacterium sp. ASV23]|uniref:porin n=1 Tax=Chromobacterium sp. ASV23 TaxID=2795110 RepID=UPI0018EA6FD0|nr:porin [Chromobacterium sp. ASV23]